MLTKIIRAGLLSVLIAVFCVNASAQLVINEVGTKNETTFTDENGQYGDWVELYNAGGATINLSGYSLSDDTLNPQKWTFGNGSIGAGEHLLVFADNDNKTDLQTVPDTSNDMTSIGWFYADESATPSGNSFIEFTEFSGTVFGTPGGNPVASGRIHYLDNTGPGELGYSYAGVYVKFNTWNAIVDRSMYNMVRVRATIDAGENILIYFSSNGVNDWENYQVTITGTGVETDYHIPVTGDTGPLDLSLMEGMSFNGTTPYGPRHIRITAIDFYHTGYYHHTNFQLSSSGESLVLSNPGGTVIDRYDIPPLNVDDSYGRKTDGNDTLVVFTTPTPGATNNGASFFTDYCYTPVNFSIPAGYYSPGQLLSLSGPSSIRYTTDGTDPDLTSPLYVSPLSLDSTVVIKAACFDGAGVPYQVYTNTYFIGDSSSLPVFSVSTHPDHFFDTLTGIYVLGPNADSANFPYFGANFWEDWERPLHIEYFVDSVKVFDQNVGVEIFGGWSRGHPMKSLKFKAKDIYGEDHMNYKFFKDKDLSSFKHLILRTSGGDFNRTHFLDAFNQQVVKGHTDLDLQYYQPVLLYINGEYWGVHNLRERMSPKYVEDNYGYNEDEITMLEAWGTLIVGDQSDFNTLDTEISSTDMSVQANFDQYIQNFDYNSYIDHFAFQNYIANWDWPQNNVKLWKKNDIGKYRFMVYDTDISLGLIIPADSNMISRMAVGHVGNTRMFYSFLSNEGFRNYFANRSADLMNTIYRPWYVHKIIDSLKANIEPEMPRQFMRWPTNNMTGWNNSIQNMRDFINIRQDYHRQHIVEAFSLNKTVDITLDASPAGAGYVHISTITPDSLPWTGVYFDGVPVTITAIPRPGFTFVNWQSSSVTVPGVTNKAITLNVNTDNTFTANFSGSYTAPEVTFSEINYNDPANPSEGDWVELYNYGATEADLSNWVFRDSENEYVIPVGTVLAPNERLVVCANLAVFNAKYPGVTRVVGGFGFKLDNGGEIISLSTMDDSIVVSMTYDDEFFWPAEADGQGYTLELVDHLGSLDNPLNWFVGCIGGSPSFAYDASCPPLATKEEQVAVSVRVFPNPTKGNAWVQIKNGRGEMLLKLQSIEGRTYMQESLDVINSSFTIPLELTNAPAGMYVLQLITEDGIVTRKVLLE